MPSGHGGWSLQPEGARTKLKHVFYPRRQSSGPGHCAFLPQAREQQSLWRWGCTSLEGGMFGAGQVRQNPYDCLNMIGPLQPSQCKGGRRGIHSGGLVGPSCLETQQ